ncbi:MAG: hypothetical protein HUU18_05230 [Phycisphaerales bacterium]|nr:hypothetical protein [Phycisphaerales bacterium]
MKNRIVSVIVLGIMSVGLSAVGGCATYKANVTNTRTVPGVEVQVAEAGGSFWAVIAKNNTNDVVKLVWDESTYVATTGESDRLLRGKTRLIHSGQAQPTSPIAPGSELREYCVRESAAEHAQFAGAPGDINKPARIILVFEIGGRKVMHESSVQFTKGK